MRVSTACTLAAAAAAVLSWPSPSTAHPDYLECSGLSTRLHNGQPIMGFKIKETTLGRAPFVISRMSQEDGSDGEDTTAAAGGHLQWTNYSFIGTQDDVEFVVEVLQPDDEAGGSNAVAAANTKAHNVISCFGHGICGSDPKHLGRGLCQKCPTSLFAMDYDCTDGMKCLFGVATNTTMAATTNAASDANVSVLVAWGAGDSITYVRVNLNSI